MADNRCNVMDRAEGKSKKACGKGCKNFMFPHLDRACVLSEVYSVKKGEGCYIYETKELLNA